MGTIECIIKNLNKNQKRNFSNLIEKKEKNRYSPINRKSGIKFCKVYEAKSSAIIIFEHEDKTSSKNLLYIIGEEIETIGTYENLNEFAEENGFHLKIIKNKRSYY